MTVAGLPSGTMFGLLTLPLQNNCPTYTFSPPNWWVRLRSMWALINGSFNLDTHSVPGLLMNSLCWGVFNPDMTIGVENGTVPRTTLPDEVTSSSSMGEYCLSSAKSYRNARFWTKWRYSAGFVITKRCLWLILLRKKEYKVPINAPCARRKRKALIT